VKAAPPSRVLAGDRYNPHVMQAATRIARLYINEKEVGDVVIRGWRGSWGFGEFKPADAFSHFAPIFGSWSLLMHADEDGEKLTPDAAEELRLAEYAIDALRAQLFLPERNEWRSIRQVNIDGKLIEWKE
jgi:hypothetical protein